MSLLSRAQELVAQLRQVIWMLRSGRKEVVAGALGIALFPAGAWLLTHPNHSPVPTDFSNYVAYSLWVVGVLLWVYVYYRIRQQAVPPPPPLPELPPAAIKGPMAFGPNDGTLFRRLGRETELTQLLSLILDDQIPLVVVRGESGVGKTSLLRAGLTHILKDQNVQYLYWEAVPTQSPERLLHVLQEQWQNSPTPQGLDDDVLRVGSQGAPRRVIVLDQFEQLHPDETTHQSIFDLFRKVATTHMPPYRTTWIVAFRREYDSFWRDFELTIPGFHPPMVRIQLFSKAQAQEILATLAEAADFTLDQALVMISSTRRHGMDAWRPSI
jgi:hypothetical protein